MWLTSMLMICASQAAPVPVEVVRTEAGPSLQRDGAPYALRGAGGHHALDTLASIGGTSIRTWGVGEETRDLLDAAHAQGLTVSVGIWLGHERHGFDYGDPAQVQAQLDTAREAVQALRDHPAVLMWGVGNEMEGFEQGDDPKVWSAVCDVAAMVQELDPHHPVMTTTAEVGGGRVAGVDACEHIDIHGINAYGGVGSVVERYRAAGGSKPVVITEYGPPGEWEIPKTDFGAPPELTSTEKAAIYAGVWRDVVDGEPLVLGAYAFLWGWKMEATATWFGLFLPDGTRLGGVDALADTWGHPVPDRAPLAEPLLLEGGDRVEPGSQVRVHWPVSDPEGATLKTRWVLRREVVERSVGGDLQGLPQAIPQAILESAPDSVLLQLPESNGVYRLYAVTRDPAGGGATASLPLLVGEPRDPDAPLPMPWYVYQDEGIGGPWVPSGWMGAIDSVDLDLGWTEGCASPPTCIRVQTTSNDWSGVAWQTPANNWGEHPGGQDLSEARWLRFKVRAKFEWGTLNTGVGLVEEDKPHHDSLKVEKEVRLSTEWQEVKIRLRGDRSHLITGFWWVLPNQKPVTLYLDDIRFE